jgi:hypothetical protein
LVILMRVGIRLRVLAKLRFSAVIVLL